MKKDYTTPELTIVECETLEIVCQSISYDGDGNGRPAEARRRNNVIFDYEDEEQ